MKSIEWPCNKKFAVCLTHDVDRVKKSHQYITNCIKKGDFHSLKSYFLEKNDPYWNFETIMEIEKKYNVRSTFFFLNESKRLNPFKPNEWKLSLGRYSLYDPKIIDIIQKLHDGGWEIGVHGSYESYKNKKLLRKEKKNLEYVLGNEVIGIRQHYLNLNIPKTWKLQEEVGFRYDASFGSTNEVGFREKQYLPFRPFSNSFLVIPLTIMDGALFQENKDGDDAWGKCIELINQAEKEGGLLTVLWHQHVFNDKEFPRWTELYEKILKYCNKNHAWITNGENVFRWCKDVN